jgi:limonene-1,2-epoxide hydrolase
MTRTLVEWTAGRVGDPALAKSLTGVFRGGPLPKPEDGRNDAQVDLFQLDLEPDQVRRIIEALAPAGESVSKRHRHALIIWREYLGFINQKESHMHAKETVDRLMSAFEHRDIEGIAGCFAADAVYHNIPMEPVRGKEAIRNSLAPFIGMASEVKFEVLRSATEGNVVMNERIDRFNIGGKWLSIAVMGVFEVGADGITAWRDYFDLAQFQSQMAAIQGG